MTVITPHRTSAAEALITDAEARDLIGAVVADIARQAHPLAPEVLPFHAARTLAYRLSQIATVAAYVVRVPGGFRVWDEDDMEAGYAERSAIVYTADSAHVAAL